MTAARLPPPFLDLPGINNIRTISGYAIESDGNEPRRIVRPGILYRSADVCRCSAETSRKLRDEYGVTTVFDIRSMPGIRGSGGGEMIAKGFEERAKEMGIQRIYAPVLEDEDCSPEGVAKRFGAYMQEGSQGFIDTYRTFLENGNTSFRKILLHLANTPPPAAGEKPVATIVHCTGGNNRTGVFIALLLDILGVSPEDIGHEYALTDIGLADILSAMQKRLEARIIATGLFSWEDGTVTQAGLDRMVSSKSENMIAMIRMLHEVWGGGEKYAKDFLGLSNEDIQKLRHNLTTEVES